MFIHERHQIGLNQSSILQNCHMFTTPCRKINGTILFWLIDKWYDDDGETVEESSSMVLTCSGL